MQGYGCAHTQGTIALALALALAIALPSRSPPPPIGGRQRVDAAFAFLLGATGPALRRRAAAYHLGLPRLHPRLHHPRRPPHPRGGRAVGAHVGQRVAGGAATAPRHPAQHQRGAARRDAARALVRVAAAMVLIHLRTVPGRGAPDRRLRRAAAGLCPTAPRGQRAAAAGAVGPSAAQLEAEVAKPRGVWRRRR